MNNLHGVVPQHRDHVAPAKLFDPAHSDLREFAGVRAVAQAQSSINLLELWRIVAKWWWLVAAIVVGAILASVAISLMIEPQYRAQTTLEINPENGQMIQMGQSPSLPMAQDRDFINTQAGLIKSRALAERVVRRLNLGANPALVNKTDGSRAKRETAAVDTLLGNLSVDPVRDSRLITVSVNSPDPTLAARVANAYGDTAIKMNLERRYEDTSYARRFLEDRIAAVRDKLQNSERELVAYARRAGIVTITTDSGNGQGGRTEQSIDAASLVSLNEALQQAKTERIAAEQRYRQARSNSSTTENLNNPTVQALTTQLAQVQAEYQDKSALFKPDYPPMVQLRMRIQSLTSAIAQESGKVSGALRSDYSAAAGRESQLAGQVNVLRGNLLNLRDRSIQYTILQREVDTNRTLYDGLLQRYKEVGVAGGVGTSPISVADQAQIPSKPFKPNLPFNIALGLFAGLFLGFGSAFALEWMDDTIKTPDDLRDKLGIAPLGVIPNAEKGETIQDQLSFARSPISEAYQSIRTSLQFASDHGVPRTLTITSTRAGEGKSSSALALAHSIASLGAKVLLIDADLRKPTFRGSSGRSVVGLSSLLAGADNLDACISPTDHGNLFLLPAGQIPPNPAELLATDRLTWILNRAREKFDFVIVDGPPVLGLADAPLIASQCEGTLMVFEAGAIRRVAAMHSLSRLQSAATRVMGGILTKFDATKSGYGYGYGYGYGSEGYHQVESDEPRRQIQLLKSA